MASISFSEFIRKEDAYDQTPAGELLKRYLEVHPDLKFIWQNNIKCVDTMTSDASMAWATYLLNEGNKVQGAAGFTDVAALNLGVGEIADGQHLIIANWYYNNCVYANRVKQSVAIRNLTRFESEHRERILTKLGKGLGQFVISYAERDAICSYCLIRRSDKFQKMFIPNKLLALQVINRFANFAAVRFEDAETILRGYTYAF